MKLKVKLILIFFFLMIPVALMESCDPGLGNDQVVDGKMMFWSNFDGPPIDVFVDSKFSGTITTFFSETPDCESQGCVTVTLIPGSYSFHAEETNVAGGTGKSWDGTITIRANGCGSLTLTK
jgi:hypothetical protein